MDRAYPRPQLRRERWTSLDGTWRFSHDDDDRGRGEGWHAPEASGRFDREIQVPFPPESPASGIGDTGFHPVVWYRREVDADIFDTPDGRPGDRLLLHFGAVDHHADVWLDGHHLGSHVGGQTPFTVDVTDVVGAAGRPSVLVVRAEDDPADPDLPRGKQDWELEPHGIWYHRTTGIWQPVWAERVPSARLVALWWQPDLAGQRVRLEATLSPDAAGVEVAVVLSIGGEDIATATAGADGTLAVVDVDLSAARGGRGCADLAWSPERPTLIDAEVTLRRPGDDAPLDSARSYLGLRDLALGRGRFLLNGAPYQVRAVLEQGYWPQTHLAAPSVDALWREVELVKELGFNTARVHQKAEDPRFLHAADTLGLLVWGETANARAFSERARSLLTAEWADLVRRDRSHPSVVAWVPVNESWGVPDIAVDAAQQRYLTDLTALTRELDPARVVLGNEGWEQLDSDVVGIHDYDVDPFGIYWRLRDDRAVLRTLRGPGPQGRRLVLGERQVAAVEAGAAPVMLTEFGGISLSAEETWGYREVGSAAELEEALTALFGAVQSCRPLAGWCFTQLTDTAQEANGLLTGDREPKLPIEVIARIVQGPPSGPPRRSRLGRWARGATRRLPWRRS